MAFASLVYTLSLFQSQVKRVLQGANVANQMPLFWHVSNQLIQLFHHNYRAVFCWLSRLSRLNLRPKRSVFFLTVQTLNTIGKSGLVKVNARGKDYVINYKDTKSKCRLYWCLIEIIDWRYSQSYWYFHSSFVNYFPSILLSG